MKEQIFNALVQNGSFLAIVSKTEVQVDRLDVFSDERIQRSKVNNDLFLTIVSEYKSLVIDNINLLFKRYYNIVDEITDYDAIKQTNKLKGKGRNTYTYAYYDTESISGFIDFWGVNTLYYFQNENSFIVSDNLFLVNHIVQEKLSDEAKYECLFFNYPLLNKTFFENIYCLTPGQKFKLIFKDFKLSIEGGSDYSELLEKDDNSLKDDFTSFYDFFNKFNKMNGDLRTFLSLSSGSDSRTILAGLLSIKSNFIPYTFGKENYDEQSQVIDLLKKIKIPAKLFNLNIAEKNFEDDYIWSTFITSGLINPYRAHYQSFSNSIDKGSNLFVGFFGSEFIKGEIAIDAMVSLPHYDVLRGSSIAEAVEKHMPELALEYKNKLIEYISSKHADIMMNVNTKAGSKNLAKFFLQYEPSRVFTPILMLAQFNNINIYAPFLDYNIIKSTFHSGLGVLNSSSLKNNFIGPIACIKPQSMMINQISKKNDNVKLIFNSMLDRKFSFSDVLTKNHKFLKMRRKMHQYADRLKTYKSDIFLGQIENSNINSVIKNYVQNEIKDELFPIQNNTENRILNKHLFNLNKIKNL